MTPEIINSKNSIDISDAYKINASTWVDVRCPREFKKGHFTNSINIPLFSDGEYQEIGQIYRKKGQDIATQIGFEYASKSKNNILNQISNLDAENLIIYCARGGMRSKGFQSLLNEAGYTSLRLNKGYKSIRNHTLNSYKSKREVIVIAGGTGPGKTTILHKMKDKGHNVIDLESLANHRGSAFGDLGLTESSTQQQFENDLSSSWNKTNPDKPVFIESESRKIGRVSIPDDIWMQMKNGFYLKIDMDINRRIKNLINDYGHFSKNDLQTRVYQISKKLGGQNVKTAIKLLEKNDLTKLCQLLLQNYYDKMYDMAYELRVSDKEIISILNETNEEIIKRILTKV